MKLETVPLGASIARVTELLEAAKQHDGHDAIGEHKGLDLVHGGREGVVGILATANDVVTGYAHLSRNGNHWGLEVVVHPDHRGLGIELKLVAEALSQCAQNGGGHLHWWTFRPSEIHDSVASALGLNRGRELKHLVRSLPAASPQLPKGIEVRTFDASTDIDTWIDVNNRAFGEHPEQGLWTREVFERRMSEPWFDHRGFLMAWRDTELVGFCWTKLNDQSGEIYVIAVNPSTPIKGLGTALVLAGCEWAYAQGKPAMTLYVDASNTPATSLYAKLGFTQDHFDRAYTIDVSHVE